MRVAQFLLEIKKKERDFSSRLLHCTQTYGSNIFSIGHRDDRRLVDV